MLTGLSIDKTPVIGYGGSIDKDMLCDRLLGWVPSASAYSSDCIKLT